jgi:hypothetical protein
MKLGRPHCAGVYSLLSVLFWVKFGNKTKSAVILQSRGGVIMRGVALCCFLFFSMGSQADLFERTVLDLNVDAYDKANRKVPVGDSKAPLDDDAATVSPDLEVRIFLEPKPSREQKAGVLPGSKPIATVHVHRQVCTGHMLPSKGSSWTIRDGFELKAPSESSALAYLTSLYDASLAALIGSDFDRAGLVVLCHRYQTPNCTTVMENMLRFEAVSKLPAAVAASMLLTLTLAAAVPGDSWATPFRARLIRNVRSVQILAAENILPKAFTFEAFEEAALKQMLSAGELAGMLAQIRSDLLVETEAAKREVVSTYIREEIRNKRARQDEKAREHADSIVLDGVRALGIGSDIKSLSKSTTVSVFTMPSTSDRTPAVLLSDAAGKMGLRATIDPEVDLRRLSVQQFEQDTDPYCLHDEKTCRGRASNIFSCFVSWLCYPMIPLTCGCCGLNRHYNSCREGFCVQSLGARIDRCCYSCLNCGRTKVRFEPL